MQTKNWSSKNPLLPPDRINVPDIVKNSGETLPSNMYCYFFPYCRKCHIELHTRCVILCVCDNMFVSEHDIRPVLSKSLEPSGK